jgi:crotonobetainyl-CoA:carnitine CoA-transferase CaiB-like acyl-CoA transferase
MLDTNKPRLQHPPDADPADSAANGLASASKGAPMTGPGALDGVRVLDLTSVVMGPYATQILGDFGADVITVEPGAGETNRIMSRGPHNQLSGVALNLLRNKRNISIDLKHPSGLQVALRLAATCDVVVTNLRPGPLQRLGLAYPDIRAVRPDVIFCQGHGYPSDSERANEPAYDDVIQAATGMADAMELTLGEPQLAATVLADKVSGLAMVCGVLAALVNRARTGEGQHVEVPMAETMTSFMLVEHGADAIPVPALGPAGYRRILNPHRRPHRTADGWIHVLPYSAANWQAILPACGHPELVEDPRVKEPRRRLAESQYLYEQIEAGLLTQTTSYWLNFCATNAIPASTVATLDELTQELPVASHAHAGRYHVLPPLARLSATPAAVRRDAPLIGEHTDELLRELGYGAGDIEQLRADRAVGARPGRSTPPTA